MRLLQKQITDANLRLRDLNYCETKLAKATGEIAESVDKYEKAETRQVQLTLKLDAVLRDVGFDRTYLDKIIAAFDDVSIRLRTIRNAVKNAKDAVTVGQRQRAEAEVESRTRELRKEFVEVDVMSTELAQEIISAGNIQFRNCRTTVFFNNFEKFERNIIYILLLFAIWDFYRH